MREIIEQVYVALALWWAEFDKLPLMSGITAMVVASLKMRSQGKIQWSEALLCGVFAVIATVSLGFLGALVGFDLPVEASSAISGAIGWYGTAKTVSFVEDKVKSRGGGANETDS